MLRTVGVACFLPSVVDPELFLPEFIMSVSRQRKKIISAVNCLPGNCILVTTLPQQFPSDVSQNRNMAMGNGRELSEKATYT
jgi:hypothetical protein